MGEGIAEGGALADGFGAGIEQGPVRTGALAWASGGHAPAQDAGDAGVGIVRVVPVLDGIVLDGEDGGSGRDVPTLAAHAGLRPSL